MITTVEIDNITPFRVIDGAFVIGMAYAGSDFNPDSDFNFDNLNSTDIEELGKKVLDDAYLLEDGRGETFDASEYRILLQRSDLPVGNTMPDFDFLIDFTSNSGSIITFFHGGGADGHYQIDASGFRIYYYKNNLTLEFHYYNGTEHIRNDININDGTVSIKQRNNNLTIKNNGTEVFNKNVKFSFKKFDNGDLILGGSDYADGSKHIYGDFGDFKLKKFECSLIEEYGH